MELVESKLLKELNIKHGMFLRTGGVSEGPFESLNFGVSGSDKKENVAKNFELAASLLKLSPKDIISLKQIHSNKVIEFTENSNRERSFYHADGLVTDLSNIAIGSLSADCVPVLLYNKNNQKIAALHAGWRGALAGIIENTVKSLGDGEIIAAIMPSISQKSYEVGEEFFQEFMTSNLEFKKYFEKNNNTKYQFDIRGFVFDKLFGLGIKNIDDVAIDTYQNKDKFFSYRRSCHEKANGTGIHLSFIIKP